MAASHLHPYDSASTPYLPQQPVDAAPVGDKRMDGRGLEQFRPIFLRTGTVSQAAGSAYIEVGATKAMAAVYGPRPTDRREAFSEEGHLGVDVKLASFSTRTRGRITQTPAERELSAQATTALVGAVQLSAFPKAAVDVYVCVLEADGGELAAAVTAGCAALADAGIPLRDLVAACSFARVKGSLVLDPCGAEQAQQEAGGTLALMTTANEVTGVLLTGGWPGDSAKDALSLALGGCGAVDAVMRETLRSAVTAAAAVGG